jgi:hypothetical protein
MRAKISCQGSGQCPLPKHLSCYCIRICRSDLSDFLVNCRYFLGKGKALPISETCVSTISGRQIEDEEHKMAHLVEA